MRPVTTVSLTSTTAHEEGDGEAEAPRLGVPERVLNWVAVEVPEAEGGWDRVWLAG